MLGYDIHNNLAQIMTKCEHFLTKNVIFKVILSYDQ